MVDQAQGRVYFVREENLKSYVAKVLQSVGSSPEDSLLVAEDSIELLVEDINRSISFLDSITKKTTKDDVLDAVFSSFCVGK